MIGLKLRKLLMLNCAICLSCNTFLWSQHRHDFVGCSCSNHTFIDGGQDYCRAGGADLSKIAKLRDGMTFGITRGVTVLSQYETLELLSKHLDWGSYGKDGKGPKVFKKLYELDTDHIKAIIRTQPQISIEYVSVFNWILKSRTDKLIKEADASFHENGLETLMSLQQHREWYFKNHP
jgi:hypothetical protein